MLYIKLILGFRKDQEYSIPENEAHKAYYAFMNEEAKVIFKDGLAIRGKDIHSIVPDYHASMGWNEGYVLSSYDHAEINGNGVARDIRDMMYLAKEVASKCTPQELSLKLSDVASTRKLLK